MGAALTAEPKAKKSKPDVSPEIVSAPASALQFQAVEGAAAGLPLFLALGLQRKLAVGAEDDPLEREADQVADAVMSARRFTAQPSPPGYGAAYSYQRKSQDDVLQRKCECGASASGACEECRTREEQQPGALAIQRRVSGNGNGGGGATPRPGGNGHRSDAAEAPAVVHEALRSPGQSLDLPVRSFMESRFGRDLSDVRVHTDSVASKSAQAVNALAYTAGPDVVFAPGQYSPKSSQGSRLLAHELAHVLQQKRSNAPEQLSRQTEAQAAAPTPAVPDQALLDRETQALATLTAKAGSEIATFAYESPMKPEYVPPAKPPTASLTMGAPVPRPTDDTQKRKGFDNQGTATAFATVIGGAAGAVVLQEDNLWFAAPLTAVSNSEFVRSNVYRFTPSPPAVVGIGKDGFVFQSQDYTPDEDRAAKVDRPEKELAAPTAVADLQKVVGIAPEDKRGERDVKAAAIVQVPPGQEEAFIRSYFVARALDALNQNEAEADKLATQFKPTGEGTGLDPSAQKMIDQTREMGPVFRKLEIMERHLGESALWLQDKHYGGRQRLTIKGQRKFIFEWMDDINESLKKIAQSKQTILSAFPLLATLVRREETPTNAKDWAAKLGYERFKANWVDPLMGAGAKLVSWAWGKVSTSGLPPEWQDSPLAKSKEQATTAENEKIAADFRTKLDEIHRAINQTRAKVTGDLDFVLEMSTLRSRVKADLATVDPRNKGLKDAMDKLLMDHDIKETEIKVAETIIQIAALFLPGGQFISAAIGFAVQAKEMDKHLDAWTASQATVDPAKALVDQQEAQSALLFDTVLMAVQAVDLAVSVKGGIEALEAGRLPKEDVTPAEDLPKKSDSEVPSDPSKAGDDQTRKARAMDDPEQMKKFVKEAPALKTAWGTTYHTAQERGQALIDMVNSRLGAGGTPPVKFRLGNARGAGGAFEHETWTVVLDSKFLAKDSLTEAELTWMIEASYHEGRHAEQFFMMARAQAGEGKTVEQLMKPAAQGGLDITDRKIAEAAVAQKVAAGSPEALQAKNWYESIFGSGRAHRQELLGKLDLAQKEVWLWEDRLEQLGKQTPRPSPEEVEEVEKDLAEAKAKAKPLIDEYKKLPEEADAYRVGEDAAAAYRQRLKELTEERIRELQKELVEGKP